jgi:hypothetical protein
MIYPFGYNGSAADSWIAADCFSPAPNENRPDGKRASGGIIQDSYRFFIPLSKKILPNFSPPLGLSSEVKALRHPNNH